MVRFCLLAALCAIPAIVRADSVSEAQEALARLRLQYAEPLEAAERALMEARNQMQERVMSASDSVAVAERALEVAMRPRPPRAGELPRGRKLGMRSGEVTEELARKLLLERAGGCLVVRIDAAGAGYVAGLREGDVIVTFDGRNVAGPRDLVGQAAVAPQDRKVYFEVWRDRRLHVLHLAAVDGIVDEAEVAKARTVLDRARAALTSVQSQEGAKVNAAEAKSVKLREEYQAKLAAAETSLVAAQSRQPTAKSSAPASATLRPGGLGLRLRNLSDSERAAGALAGAVVVEVKNEGIAASAGVVVDDIVVAFRGVPVSDARQLIEEAKRAPTDRRIYIEVVRAGRMLMLSSLAGSPATEPTSSATERSPEAAPARNDNRHLLPQRASGAGSNDGDAAVTVASSNAVKAKYTTTRDYQRVFKDLTEFLAWQSANGKEGALYNRTAFDFYDAADGGRVRFAGQLQECYVFDDRGAFERYAGEATRSYYNVKCHSDGAVVAF